MARSVKPYVATVCFAAGIMLAALYATTSIPSETALTAVLFLLALGLLGEWLVYALPHGATGSIAFIPFLAAACIAPSWVTAVGIGATVFLSQIARRVTPIKVLFNVAEHVLTLSAAILAYHLAGGVSFYDWADKSLLGIVQSAAVPVAALIVVFFLMNSVVVSGVLARAQARRTTEIWLESVWSLAVYDVIASPIIVMLAFVVVQWGVVGAFLLALPVLGVRQLHITNLQLRQVNQDLLELMVKAIEARDAYTSGHSRRVAQYALVVGRILGLSQRELDRVRTAALLHDVGKIHEDFAPILSKPDKLTPAEWAVMKTHPVRSAELVAAATHLRDLVPAVRHHHENWDGSGYPDGLAGEAIPLESRIIMFADTIDAMTTERPYRPAMSEAEVHAELVRWRGSQFDPDICDRLLQSPSFSHIFPPEKRAQRSTPPTLMRRSGELLAYRVAAGK